MDSTDLHPLTGEALTESSARGHPPRCYLVYHDGGPPGDAALASALDVIHPGTLIVVSTWAPSGAPEGRSASGVDRKLAAAASRAAQRGAQFTARTLTGSDLASALLTQAAACSADIIFWGLDREELEAGLTPPARFILRFARAKVVLVGV